MSKSANEKAHLARLHELPCAVCGATEGIQAHHILDGRIPGRKSPDFTAIPLCADCHQDPQNGIHGLKCMWSVFHQWELKALGETVEKLLYSR